MSRYLNIVLLVIFMIATGAAQKDIGLKEFYYPPASKLFDARHYFKTLQYYNDEIAAMKVTTSKDSADLANIYYLRGRCKFELTDKRGASDDLTLAIQFFNKQESFYYYRGLSNHWLKRYDMALADYNKAIELNPNKMAYYVNRGFVKYLDGDLNAACYDFSKAGENGSFEIYQVIKDYCN